VANTTVAFGTVCKVPVVARGVFAIPLCYIVLLWTRETLLVAESSTPTTAQRTVVFWETHKLISEHVGTYVGLSSSG